MDKMNEVRQINPTDKQTREIVQGILFLITNYPEAKLLVDYDNEIIMILPKETRVPDDEREVLVRLGWENLEYKPWMWQFQVEGYVAEYY